MSDNAWLAAYEAQKAEVRKKMQQKSQSISGTSKFSGLVDHEKVQHVVKSNQVTKLMNNLKKPSGIRETPKYPQISAPKMPANIVQAQAASANMKQTEAFSGMTRPVEHCHVTNLTSAATTPSGPSTSLSSTQIRPEMPSQKRKKKNDQGGGIPIKDLIKKVKSDASRKPSDWAQVTTLQSITLIDTSALGCLVNHYRRRVFAQNKMNLLHMNFYNFIQNYFCL
jgi:hypothetical protein